MIEKPSSSSSSRPTRFSRRFLLSGAGILVLLALVYGALRGERVEVVTAARGVFDDTYNYNDARLYIDVTAEYFFHKKFGVFLNIRNVNLRLKLIFGEKAGLSFSVDSHGNTVATIHQPLQPSEPK